MRLPLQRSSRSISVSADGPLGHWRVASGEEPGFFGALSSDNRNQSGGPFERYPLGPYAGGALTCDFCQAHFPPPTKRLIRRHGVEGRVVLTVRHLLAT
jgi:hypothetical protein